MSTSIIPLDRPLAAIRECASLTKAKAARHVGITDEAWGQQERLGGRVNFATVRRAAETFGFVLTLTARRIDDDRFGLWRSLRAWLAPMARIDPDDVSRAAAHDALLAAEVDDASGVAHALARIRDALSPGNARKQVAGYWANVERLALRDAPPAPPSGFAGRRGRVLSEVHDGPHVVRVVEYSFSDGSTSPFVEFHETHDGARPGRVFSLSTLVHLAQNVGDEETWRISTRETPGE